MHVDVQRRVNVNLLAIACNGRLSWYGWPNDNVTKTMQVHDNVVCCLLSVHVDVHGFVQKISASFAFTR